MGTTTTYAFRYPELTDAPNGPQGFANLANDVETALKAPLFIGTAGAATTLPTAVWTPVLLSTETIDTHNGHSTVTNTSRYTVPAGWGGYYEVGGSTYFQGGTGGSTRATRVAKNGTGIVYSQCNSTITDAVTIASAPVILQLIAGDYVELQAFQNSGANRTTFQDQTVFNVKFLRR